MRRGEELGIRGNWKKRRVGLLLLGEIDRRTFVKLTGLSTAALVFGVGPSAQKAWVETRFPDYPFSLGVASGDPSPDGVVLWTWLAPDPLNDGEMPGSEVPVRWEVASDEGFRRVTQEGDETARPDLAHSVHVEVTEPHKPFSIPPVDERISRSKEGAR
jgi:phosphodiesterase/alkaline phosphatase D-like protein